jgi:diadenosine tetraphosphate (Ap4A) HIT family hydrolase
VELNAFPVPGWLVVVCHRHVESLDELTEAEARELGGALRTASTVLRQVVGCSKTYVLLFGEQTSHLHVSVIARMPGLDPGLQSAGILRYTERQPLSTAEVQSLGNRLAGAWRQSAGRG